MGSKFPEPQPEHLKHDLSQYDIYCRCGRRNEFGLRNCIGCGKSLKLTQYPPPPNPHETLVQYAMRCGPILGA